MAITASQVKELRDRTGIAMMKCKKALEEADGDLDAAIENLRKAGEATADKKSDRETNCGGIGIAYDGGAGTIVLLACETDFVSSNAEFKDFVNQLAKVALETGATSVDALNDGAMGEGTVRDAIVGMVAKIGENLQLTAVDRLEGAVVTGYNHGGRVATLVAGSGDGGALRNVAMHVAAANPAPIALKRDGVPQELLDKEREIIAASPEIESKPENIRPKIIEGKLGRFFKEHVLLEQEMLVDNDDHSSVEKWAKAKGLTIEDFKRSEV